LLQRRRATASRPPAIDSLVTSVPVVAGSRVSLELDGSPISSPQRTCPPATIAIAAWLRCSRFRVKVGVPVEIRRHPGWTSRRSPRGAIRHARLHLRLQESAFAPPALVQVVRSRRRGHVRADARIHAKVGACGCPLTARFAIRGVRPLSRVRFPGYLDQFGGWARNGVHRLAGHPMAVSAGGLAHAPVAADESRWTRSTTAARSQRDATLCLSEMLRKCFMCVRKRAGPCTELPFLGRFRPSWSAAKAGCAVATASRSGSPTAAARPPRFAARSQHRAVILGRSSTSCGQGGERLGERVAAWSRYLG
jgi:hypothetical protein